MTGATEIEDGCGLAGASAPSRPALLYAVHRLPYPPDKGDRIRAFHLLKALSKRSAVHLACLADEPPAPGAVVALEEHCERVAVCRVGGWGRRGRMVRALASGRTVTEGAFECPELAATIRRWALQTRFHAALASSSGMVSYLRVGELRGVPAVADLVDVDSQKWLDYAAAGRGPLAWLFRLEGRRLHRLESDLPAWARGVTLVSEAEASLYRAACPGAAAHAITNGVDLEAFRPGTGAAPEVEEGCVFVGALDYRPNVDAAVWFCHEVWPEVHRRCPEAILSLVGRNPVAAVRRLGREPGVRVVGTVPDVRPHLAGAAVALAPLRIARGVQNKVLEALAMGKAVVASPGALEGLDVEPGVHLLAASRPEEWADTIVRLLRDETLRGRLGVAGRRFVERRHDWETCLEPFAALLGLTSAARRPAVAEVRSTWGDE